MTTSLRELEKRLAQEPDNLPLRVTVAGMLRESGRGAEAVEHYRKVAIAYRTLGRQQQALAVCRSILELAPDDAAIHALVAELSEPRTPVPGAAGTGPGESGPAPTKDIEIELSDPGLIIDEPTRDPMRDDDAVAEPGMPRRGSAADGQRGVVAEGDDDQTRPPATTGSRPSASAFAKVPSPAGTRGATKSSPPGELHAPASKSPPPVKSSAAPLPHVPKAAHDPAPSVPKSAPPVLSSPPGASPAKPAPVLRSAAGASSPKSAPPTIKIPPKTKSAPPASAQTPPSRPSFEVDTPLPRPIPYHIADPTSSQTKLAREEAQHDSVDESLETRPGENRKHGPKRLAAEVDTTGLAQAARRISGLIAPFTRGAPKELDLAAELETLQRPRLSAEDLEKVQHPPPTVPTEQVVLDDDLPTPVPRTTWTKGPPIRDTPIDPRTDLHGAVPVQDDRDDDLTNPIDLTGLSPLANAFFTPLPTNRREAAHARCVRRDVRAGAIVVRQGETAHPLILVMTGQLELRVERANGSIVRLDTIDAGQYIGEAALLGRTPATASLVALTESELLTLPPHALFELAGAFPALWAALKDSAERRTRQYEKLVRG